MRVLSIDPSVNHVGWTVFDTKHEQVEVFRLALKGGVKGKAPKNKLAEFALNAKQAAWTWGTFELEGSSLMMRIVDLLQQINAVHDGFNFDYLITEKPAFFDNQRGIIAARQNYTIDLAYINGMVGGWMHMDHRKHHTITAITWKGSVSKEVTGKHFFRCFPGRTKGISEHSIDSTMLLHYWLQTWASVSPLVARHTDSELIRGLL